MSTDRRRARPPAERPGSRAGARADGARRGGPGLRTAVLIALALAAAALAWANLAQPPRVESSAVNTELLVSRPAQQMTLQLNQPVAAIAADDLRITPETPIEATSDGTTVTIRFSEMLDYDTDYRLSARVTGAFTGVAGTLETTIRTPDPAVTTLARADDGDRVVEYRLHDTATSRTLLQADRIQQYARIDDERLLAVTLSSAGARLAYYPVGGDGLDPDSVLFDVSDLDQLRSESRAGKAGIVATGTGTDGQQYDDTLLLFDTATDAAPFTRVNGPDGAALGVADWRFVPGTTATVILGTDAQLYLHRFTPDEETIPLGTADSILGFMPGSARVLIERDGQRLEADLAEAPFADAAELPDFAPSDAVLPAERADIAPESETSRIGRSCTSPNGEYLAVEIVSPEGVPDGYPGEPGFTHTTTQFIRIEDAGEGTGDGTGDDPGGASGGESAEAILRGATDRSVVGGLSDWCG